MSDFSEARLDLLTELRVTVRIPLLLQTACAIVQWGRCHHPRRATLTQKDKLFKFLFSPRKTNLISVDSIWQDAGLKYDNKTIPPWTSSVSGDSFRRQTRGEGTGQLTSGDWWLCSIDRGGAFLLSQVGIWSGSVAPPKALHKLWLQWFSTGGAAGHRTMVFSVEIMPRPYLCSTTKSLTHCDLQKHKNKINAPIDIKFRKPSVVISAVFFFSFGFI